MRFSATRSANASRPSMRSVPAVACRMPIRSRNSVVLPAPLGPRSPQICPAGTLHDTPASAVLAPNVFTTPTSATSGGGSTLRKPSSIACPSIESMADLLR